MKPRKLTKSEEKELEKKLDIWEAELLLQYKSMSHMKRQILWDILEVLSKYGI